jgi:hypothetical protein
MLAGPRVMHVVAQTPFHPSLRRQPAASKALASFDYPPVAAVTLSYPLSAVRDDRKAPDGSVPGFGQLHPRTQVRGPKGR